VRWRRGGIEVKHITLEAIGLGLVMLGMAWLSVKFFLPIFCRIYS
jgi:hypothetical protein